MTPQKFTVSVVVPAYNEEVGIAAFLERLQGTLKGLDYEIIVVDDGSVDGTLTVLSALAAKNDRIKAISFTRNFGHQMALSAGYKYAQGDCVVTIDADMQDPPELITELIEKWQEGYKIVYAKRREREETIFKRVTASLFYRVLNTFSETPVPIDVGDFRLVDREVAELIGQLPEKSRFLRGLVAWGGFSATSVDFIRRKRMHGKTHYPFFKMLNFALDGVVSFSTKPLKMAIYLGIIASLLGFSGIVYAIWRRFFLPHEFWVTGWTALFVAIVFFGGIQLFTTGIIGEYIGKIYKEVQGRPMYLVKETVNIERQKI
ncbi:hypothetical protein A3D80_01650 [Candidatus Roizmanbacteria bacterium RIFCSPHIGHO2_02_FULL_40_13b]|uniref:Glycosyltransferase 2-like domain-containing protein n=1 Tax=Candidatus Roizmanbacteria bacterium RIFCSPHIGHO2_01_FULL_39_24 TaxID=1802032 RepID=A0A1F7GJ02_9BACT|nr:MAG: hypothetical protein A2799_02925 [Candidatus Roizmanbacteria bacterium RIFCSPHIGHO2_01_FULL_39_24]OGK26856.1 MAG: hypothetical protein A3D80_01650 [Candidatus Roizmanbacteria bacterium RIFCSPHIGHO2_02_FULL_40_13b]OGK49747.1 MAG: hypothetical protein A3A56_00430 [Candidatus Roizmanbacteria bacterium RIFCSPLOWO2_01_FULL_40_32]OGK57403.1 MAG: hypothetical protein A3H83_04115 [Candidatus Roizmanbacteria bacterium RIFCSPLOWO2_02_FULL_39_8]